MVCFQIAQYSGEWWLSYTRILFDFDIYQFVQEAHHWQLLVAICVLTHLYRVFESTFIISVHMEYGFVGIRCDYVFSVIRSIWSIFILNNCFSSEIHFDLWLCCLLCLFSPYPSKMMYLKLIKGTFSQCWTRLTHFDSLKDNAPSLRFCNAIAIWWSVPNAAVFQCDTLLLFLYIVWAC